MTIEQLKAAHYDSLAIIEFHQNRMREINKAISDAMAAEKKVAKATEATKVEELAKVD